jgi:N-methylhydantoinase A
VPQAAWGILRLANANMAEMVRLATLRRGLDPRDFVLVAFGGAGPLHACEIAAEVGIPKVVVPVYPGLFSALGTVLGEMRHDLVQTHLRRLSAVEPAELLAAFAGLERRARELIAAETVEHAADWSLEQQVDLRFEGQLFELTVPLGRDGEPTPDLLERSFRARHVETYGYDLPEHTVEVVNLRLVARARLWRGQHPTMLAQPSGGGARRRRIATADGGRTEVDVIRRADLQPGQVLAGPMIVEDFGATIRVLAGQTATVKLSGVLEIEVANG